MCETLVHLAAGDLRSATVYATIADVGAMQGRYKRIVALVVLCPGTTLVSHSILAHHCLIVSGRAGVLLERVGVRVCLIVGMVSGTLAWQVSGGFGSEVVRTLIPIVVLKEADLLLAGLLLCLILLLQELHLLLKFFQKLLYCRLIFACQLS